MRGRLITLATLVVALSFASSASAGTVHVETTGTDAAACGTSGSPCKTLKYAVDTIAVSGDSVVLGAGTFPVTTTILVNQKSLAISGAGIAATILDGEDTTTLGNNGMLRYASSVTPTTQSVSDLQIIRAGRNGTGASTRRFSIAVVPPTVGGLAVDMTINRVAFVGTGLIETPVYDTQNPGLLTVTDSTFTNVNGNPILFEQNTGGATITGNTLSTLAAVSDSAIFLWAHAAGPSPRDVVGHIEVSDNTINAGSGVSVLAGGNGTLGSSFLGGVDISDNTITARTSAGVSVNNAANRPDTTPSLLAGIVIDGNTIRQSTTAADGVRVTGATTGTQITGNDIRGMSRGVAFVLGSAVGATQGTGAVVNRNQIVGNTVAGVFSTQPLQAVDATNNWWGCNEGPGQVGCDTISGTNIDADPWLVLGISASPAAVAPAGSTTVTADLGTNSDGDAVSVFPDGSPVGFSAVGGTVTPTIGLLAADVATTTFQSLVPTGRSVSATVDNATATVTFDDAPAVITGPTVLGTLYPYRTLTCDPGTWTGSPTFAYEWLLDGNVIPGANDPTYLVRLTDQGHTISCRVTASNPSGTADATSPTRFIPLVWGGGPTDPVPPVPGGTTTTTTTPPPPPPAPVVTTGATKTDPAVLLARKSTSVRSTALGLPSAKRCVGRSLALKIGNPTGVTVRHVVVKVRGKRFSVKKRAGKYASTVSTKSIKGKTFVVRVTAWSTTGITLHAQRTYHRC